MLHRKLISSDIPSIHAPLNIIRNHLDVVYDERIPVVKIYTESGSKSFYLGFPSLKIPLTEEGTIILKYSVKCSSSGAKFRFGLVPLTETETFLTPEGGITFSYDSAFCPLMEEHYHTGSYEIRTLFALFSPSFSSFVRIDSGFSSSDNPAEIPKYVRYVYPVLFCKLQNDQFILLREISISFYGKEETPFVSISSELGQIFGYDETGYSAISSSEGFVPSSFPSERVLVVVSKEKNKEPTSRLIISRGIFSLVDNAVDGDAVPFVVSRKDPTSIYAPLLVTPSGKIIISQDAVSGSIFDFIDNKESLHASADFAVEGTSEFDTVNADTVNADTISTTDATVSNELHVGSLSVNTGAFVNELQANDIFTSDAHVGKLYGETEAFVNKLFVSGVLVSNATSTFLNGINVSGDAIVDNIQSSGWTRTLNFEMKEPGEETFILAKSQTRTLTVNGKLEVFYRTDSQDVGLFYIDSDGKRWKLKLDTIAREPAFGAYSSSDPLVVDLSEDDWYTERIVTDDESGNPTSIPHDVSIGRTFRIPIVPNSSNLVAEVNNSSVLSHERTIHVIQDTDMILHIFLNTFVRNLNKVKVNGSVGLYWKDDSDAVHSITTYKYEFSEFGKATVKYSYHACGCKNEWFWHAPRCQSQELDIFYSRDNVLHIDHNKYYQGSKDSGKYSSVDEYDRYGLGTHPQGSEGNTSYGYAILNADFGIKMKGNNVVSDGPTSSAHCLVECSTDNKVQNLSQETSYDSSREYEYDSGQFDDREGSDFHKAYHTVNPLYDGGRYSSLVGLCGTYDVVSINPTGSDANKRVNEFLILDSLTTSSDGPSVTSKPSSNQLSFTIPAGTKLKEIGIEIYFDKVTYDADAINVDSSIPVQGEFPSFMRLPDGSYVDLVSSKYEYKLYKSSFFKLLPGKYRVWFEVL